MSQEDVEVVRQAFDRFNRRDLAGAVAVFERDAEWVPYLAALEEEIYRGRDDIERMWIEVLRDVPDFRIEFVQVVADSPDTVVVEVEFRGTGKASGADIRTTVFAGQARSRLPWTRRHPRVDGKPAGGRGGSFRAAQLHDER